MIFEENAGSTPSMTLEGRRLEVPNRTCSNGCVGSLDALGNSIVEAVHDYVPVIDNKTRSV